MLCAASSRERQKREAASRSTSAELLSLGPLLLGHDTGLEIHPRPKLDASESERDIEIQTGLRVSVSAIGVVVSLLSAIGAMVLFTLALRAWANARKKPDSHTP